LLLNSANNVASGRDRGANGDVLPHSSGDCDAARRVAPRLRGGAIRGRDQRSSRRRTASLGNVELRIRGL